MIKIILPEESNALATTITEVELKACLQVAQNRPSIKENLTLKMYEIADDTKKLYDTDLITVVQAEDRTGTYLCCVNKSKEDITLQATLSSLALEGNYTAYCILSREEIGVINSTMSLIIPALNVILVKLNKAN